jgi:protein-S-isoprenylcysteine O-methyltransferase Ste14
MQRLYLFVDDFAFAAVIAIWFLFGGVFFFRRRPKSGEQTIRAPRSWAGLALQGVGFAVVWAVRRTPAYTPLIERQFALNVVLEVLAVMVAAASVWLVLSAVRELGKQWSLQARLVEGHKLITTGVYQIVRHPIYTAMFGMLVATGIVYSHWAALIAGTVVFWIGTKIRTVSEERLLAEAFGEEFTEWKARVPGLIPFIHGHYGRCRMPK